MGRDKQEEVDIFSEMQNTPKFIEKEGTPSIGN